MFIIVFGHLNEHLPILGKSADLSPHSYMAVQSFFVLGGFFAYMNLKKYDFCGLMMKTYHRILPPFLFSVILSIYLWHTSSTLLIKAFFLLPGLYPASQILYAGDWFLGVYFWLICFFSYIYIYNLKWANYLTVIVIFCFFCISVNAQADNSFMSTYWHVIPSELPRGFISIGGGFLLGSVSDKIKIEKSLLSIAIFTFFEFYFLRLFFNFLLSPAPSKYSFNLLEWTIVNCFLVYSFYNLNGMISILINKIDKVNYVSRYVFSFFMAHMIPMHYVYVNKSNYPAAEICFAFLGATIVLTLIEYHLFSKRLYPYAVAWLRKILF